MCIRDSFWGGASVGAQFVGGVDLFIDGPVDDVLQVAFVQRIYRLQDFVQGELVERALFIFVFEYFLPGDAV